ncbi:hypothetical protein ACFYY2_34060 [Streptomyces sp. NPDC001822]|uniref:hypothetical protein n=1 Tax=Streptomyces sp. NPDC001822 TaxID=3364614 RepID=UPI0036CE6BF6
MLMPMQWGRAAEVAPRVIELAGQHGLLCFDSQAKVVHVPSITSHAQRRPPRHSIRATES